MKGRGIEWIFQFFISIHSFDEGEGQPWACNKLKQLPWKVISASNLSYNILNSDLSMILWYMALNLDSNFRKIALDCAYLTSLIDVNYIHKLLNYHFYIISVN